MTEDILRLLEVWLVRPRSFSPVISCQVDMYSVMADAAGCNALLAPDGALQAYAIEVQARQLLPSGLASLLGSCA